MSFHVPKWSIRRLKTLCWFLASGTRTGSSRPTELSISKPSPCFLNRRLRPMFCFHATTWRSGVSFRFVENSAFSCTIINNRLEIVLMKEYHIPSCEEFCRGRDEFTKHEKRDTMCRVATFLVNHWWGKPGKCPTRSAS